MNDILIPVAFVTGGGAALGLILGLVAKFMFVPIDELAEKIINALPGANCGACGYAGCGDYGEHLADGSETKTNLCTPGGASTVAAVSALLGVEAGAISTLTSVLHCNGNCDNTTAGVDYEGPPTCADCASFFSGKGSCSYGCMGFGDCVPVCQFDAIYMHNGIPVIDKTRCTGCNACATACPHHLFTMEPITAEVHVACSSDDRGNIVRKACTVGCIGCKRCVRECEFDAITQDNWLAVIDTEKCTNCYKCIEVCPTNSIVCIPVPERVEA